VALEISENMCLVALRLAEIISWLEFTLPLISWVEQKLSNVQASSFENGSPFNSRYLKYSNNASEISSDFL
jgi:hypothetical protein